jgi:microcystin-dependent protein
MDGFIGEVKYFTGNFAPMNWLFCEGQQLPIVQYTPLYSLIGTQFGGDGKNYFNLPDFRGRMALNAGSGTGLTPRTQGDKGGTETIQLSQSTMPIHNHEVKCEANPAPPQKKNTPVGNIYALNSGGTAYAPGTGINSQMTPSMLTPIGQAQAHENMMPWLSVNYIICIYGYYPIRP